jgi:hypothetical protein
MLELNDLGIVVMACSLLGNVVLGCTLMIIVWEKNLKN